jgi:hypothetical protein
VKPLIIPYKVFPDPQGRPGYVALLNVQLALPALNSPRTKRFEAVIDSGATRCLFHADIAKHLGIDLKACPSYDTQGIDGPTPVYIHDVTLYIPGGPMQTSVGFKTDLPVAGLLGMSGFFDHFKVTFDSSGQFCELERIYHA